MKITRIIYFLLVATLFFSASQADSKELLCQEFTKLLHSYHVASKDIAVEMLHSIYLIEKSLNDEPNVGVMKATSDAVNERAQAFEKASKGIHYYIGENEASLVQFKDIIETIKSDLSFENISIINKFSSSVGAFSDTAKEAKFTVYANEGWANSGIMVHSSDIIWVESKGGWRVSVSYDYVGWQGYSKHSSKAYSLNNTVPLGALLFRVRGASNPNGFGLNEKKRGRIDSNGRLEFIINDSDRKNNDGQLNLRVIVFDGEKLKALMQTLQNMKNSSKQ